jgi:hypothetical protein
LDLAGAMGASCVVRLFDRLSWQSCRHSRSTGRCDTGLSNLLRRSAVHSGTVARRSINDPTTSDRKRRSTDLLVPHDSDPKTTPDSRTGRVVYALLVRRTCRTVRSIWVLQAKWTAVGTHRVFATRSLARSSVSRCSI